jgi:hypothetical protein
MQRNSWILSILLGIFCSGCIEPFEPEVDEEREVLVIDGRITDLAGPQVITVSRSSPYNNPQFWPVTGCVVRVEDDSGEGITYSENGTGKYEAIPGQGFAAVGRSYKLIVSTPDGNVYESGYDSLLACAPIDSLSYKVEKQATSNPAVNYYGVRFYVDVKSSPGESRNYMWTYEETWEYLAYYPIQYVWDGVDFIEYTPYLQGYDICYMSHRIPEFQVGSSNLLQTSEIRQQPLYFVSNQTPRLEVKYSLNVLQYSLSYDAFLYLDRIKSQSSGDWGLYESQPSSPGGNICNVNDPEEKVLGYFFASQVKEKRIMVSENFDFRIARFDCPLDTAYLLGDFGDFYPYFMFSISFLGSGPPYAYSYKQCHDCTYRGGVTTKPEYWDD